MMDCCELVPPLYVIMGNRLSLLYKKRKLCHRVYSDSILTSHCHHSRIVMEFMLESHQRCRILIYHCYSGAPCFPSINLHYLRKPVSQRGLVRYHAILYVRSFYCLFMYLYDNVSLWKCHLDIFHVARYLVVLARNKCSISLKLYFPYCHCYKYKSKVHP